MQVEFYQIQNIIQTSIDLTFKKMVMEMGEVPKKSLSQAQAYKLFGRGMVAKWEKEGLLDAPKEANSKFKYDRMRLEVLKASSNLTNILNR